MKIYSTVINVTKAKAPEIDKKVEHLVELSSDRVFQDDISKMYNYMLDTIPHNLRTGYASFTTFGASLWKGQSLVNRQLPHILGNTIYCLFNMKGSVASYARNGEVYNNIFNNYRFGGCLILCNDSIIKVYDGIIDNDEVFIDSNGYVNGKIDEKAFRTLKKDNIYYLSSQAILKYIPTKEKKFQCITRLNLPIDSPHLKLNSLTKVDDKYLEKYIIT